jgi:hypothetical protein
MTMVLVLPLALYAVFALPLGGGQTPGATMTLADILEVYRRSDRLDDEQVVVRQCGNANWDTLNRLIEGEVSLTEAAATLHQNIERLPPRRRPKVSSCFHEQDEEGRMRMTVEWAEMLLNNHPRREEIRARLHRELQAYRDAHGCSAPQPSEGRPCGPCEVPMKAARSSQE